jgi:hypothetical protein
VCVSLVVWFTEAEMTADFCCGNKSNLGSWKVVGQRKASVGA